MKKGRLYGGIEGGGTKWVCVVGYDAQNILEERVVETKSPHETIAEVCQFFTDMHHTYGRLHSLGVGTFGPIERDVKSSRYGTYLNTPKVEWSSFDLQAALRSYLGEELSIRIETDVNTAVMAEVEFGVGRGCDNVVYLTIGTGIGGACVQSGKLLTGRLHTELGHIPLPNLDDTPSMATSSCPYHSSCLEGRASGPAIEKRWRVQARDLPTTHPAWMLEARYLGSALVTLTACYSPDIIVLGGGVTQNSHLVGLVREAFSNYYGGYWQLPNLEEYIQSSTLENRAGAYGALLLASRPELFS